MKATITAGRAGIGATPRSAQKPVNSAVSPAIARRVAAEKASAEAWTYASKCSWLRRRTAGRSLTVEAAVMIRDSTGLSLSQLAVGPIIAGKIRRATLLRRLAHVGITKC